MQHNKLIISLLLLIFNNLFTFALDPDKEKIDRSYLILPSTSFDADKGFEYGANITYFDYGKGGIFAPNFRNYIYAEGSFFTKGSKTFILKTDSRMLGRNTRMLFDIEATTDKAMDFYGFNGRQSLFNKNFIDPQSEEYITRVFYKYRYQFISIKNDFQGRFFHDKIRWIAGAGYRNITTNTVDFDNINRSVSKNDELKDTITLLSEYFRYGLVPESQQKGGDVIFLKAGLIYDSRDIESNPSQGIWSELVVLNSPSFFNSNQHGFTKIAFTHRQYIPIVKNKTIVAYRISYQPIISGEMPYYMLPMIINTTFTENGLGGKRTLRGIFRNRIVGEDIMYSNIELRHKIWRKDFKKNILEIFIRPFADAGLVTQSISIDTSPIPTAGTNQYFTNYTQDNLHISYGLGISAAIDKNLILTVDNAFPIDENDGRWGLYIVFGLLF